MPKAQCGARLPSRSVLFIISDSMPIDSFCTISFNTWLTSARSGMKRLCRMCNSSLSISLDKLAPSSVFIGLPLSDCKREKGKDTLDRGKTFPHRYTFHTSHSITFKY